MRNTLFLVTVVCCNTAIAQDSISALVAPAFNRILVGFNVSPDYCFRTLNISNSGQGDMNFMDFRNADDQPKFGYSVGINVQYNFSPHWGLVVGAQYADRGYASERTLNYVFIDPNDPAIPKHTKSRYDHTYVDIPVRLNFQAGRQRLRFVASLGIAGNVFLKATELTETKYEDGHVERKREDSSYHYRSVNLSAIGSIGAVYILAERASLQLEPNFLYNLFPIFHTSRKGYLWSSGLNLTFNYALR